MERDEFRPRIGRRPHEDRNRVPDFRAQMSRAIAKVGGFRSRSKRAAPQRGRVAVREPHALSRRCVIKGRYVQLNGHGSRKATQHLAYLERDGVERDGSAGRLYGSDERFAADEFRTAIDGEKRQFRFIVSPEDADRLDLKEFTREFMRQVEKDTGRRLMWSAVNHHNTDNPHVHIVIRGVDRDGDEVRIDGRYIGREMRWRAQEIVTRELGPRLETDLGRERARNIDDERLTETDHLLGKMLAADGTVTLKELLAAPRPDGLDCIARLQTLSRLDLAREESPGMWRLADGWKESVAALGERQHLLERLFPLVGPEAIQYQALDPKIPVPAVQGTVTGKGLDDELTGKMFVAVATAKGSGYYIRVEPEVADKMRPGDAVRVGVEVERWVRPADRIIARAAEENGGIYDPARHQQSLESRERLDRQRSQSEQPTPKERVEANVRRLERLARYHLVTALGDGRWQIPRDLLGQLESRERTHPQHRVRVEPVHRTPDQSRIKEDDKRSVMQREAFGQRLAKELRMPYVPEPATFSGRAMPCAPLADGRQFVRIVDERNWRFTVIERTPEIERAFGRVVGLSWDRERCLTLQLTRGISR